MTKLYNVRLLYANANADHDITVVAKNQINAVVVANNYLRRTGDIQATIGRVRPLLACSPDRAKAAYRLQSC